MEDTELVSLYSRSVKINMFDTVLQNLIKEQRRWQRYRDVGLKITKKCAGDIVNLQQTISIMQRKRRQVDESTSTYFGSKNVQLVQLRIFETPCLAAADAVDIAARQVSRTAKFYCDECGKRSHGRR
jgi:hypothetical protein